MGSKRTWCRKHLLLCFACGIITFGLSHGCLFHPGAGPEINSAMTEPVAPPMSTDAQKAPATVTPAVSPENKHIDAAHLALAARNHTAASLEIEMASLQGPPSITPETIYLTGLLYADPENPAVDIAKAHKALQRIITEYPESGRRAEARILSEVLHWTQTTESENNRLRQEVVRLEKKLTEERNSVQQLKSLLEKMKKIDLDFTSEK